MTKTKSTRSPLVPLAGVGGALLAAAVVAAAVLIPVPAITLQAARTEVAPSPGAQTRICPGGLVDILSRSGDATTFQGFAAADVVTSTLNTSITQTSLPAPDNVTADANFGPQLLQSEPSTDPLRPALAAGAQSQSTSADSIAGLAAASCGEASTDQWLVGGSTEVGRTTLIFLANSLAVDATASLEVFGEKGRIEAPGMSAIMVKAHSQRIISLASFAPNVVEPVVHVVTTGGQVLATMQQTVTRVVTASGVDFIQAGAAPSTTQIIPGVALTGMSGQDSEGGAVTSDLAPAIRVLLPGRQDSEVTATVVSASAKPIVIKAKVTAGRVLQLPFLGVPDGIYTVVVTSAEPVLAGARSIQSPTNQPAPVSASAPSPSPTQTNEPVNGPIGGIDAGSDAGPMPALPTAIGGDFAWNASALALSSQTLVAIPVGPSPTLTFFNSADQAKTFTAEFSDGSSQTLSVPAGGGLVVPVTSGSRVSLKDAAGLYAAVTFRGVGRGSAFTVAPASRLSSPITVYPR